MKYWDSTSRTMQHANMICWCKDLMMQLAIRKMKESIESMGNSSNSPKRGNTKAVQLSAIVIFVGHEGTAEGPRWSLQREGRNTVLHCLAAGFSVEFGLPLDYLWAPSGLHGPTVPESFLRM